MAVTDPLAAAAREYPDAAALVWDGGGLSFRELDAETDRIAERLRPGRLAIARPADAMTVAAMCACFRAGTTACPLNLRLPAAAREEQMRFLGADMLLDERGLSGTGTGSGIDGPAATILFTSGSSGAPKAVTHPLRAHLASAEGANRNLALGPGDVSLLSLPLYHVAGIGILVRALSAGATLRLGGVDRMHLASHASLVPTQLARLLDQGADLSGARGILLGGAPIPRGLVDRIVAAELPVRTTYGMTETASQVTATRGSSAAELRTAGRVLAGRELRVAEDGEIEVRGAVVFSGYVGGAARDPTAWFATGDLGELSECGELLVRGRKDFRFVSGGENIQPEVIESVLLECSGIVAAAVVPQADEEFGQRPFAYVRAAEWAPREWERALRDVLPGYMVPVGWDEWPGSVAGEGWKADRQRLCDWHNRL